VKAFLIDSPEKFDMKEIEVVVPAPFLLSRNALWIYLGIGIVLTILFMLKLQKRRRMKETSDNKKSRTHEMEIKAKEDYEFMQRIQLWMEKNYKNPDLDVEALIQYLSMSLADFEGQLKRITNKTPKEYISEFRLNKAKQMLEHTNESVADISFELGFANAPQFNRLFQEATGMTPSQYRDSQRQADITDGTTEYEVIN
jgi:transcriptional regulator GlxA family with amidase domain